MARSRSALVRALSGVVAGLVLVTTADARPVAATGRADVVPPCAAERPDEASAVAAARACGAPVEISAGRGEYTQAFGNPDGTATLAATAVPVRVHRADGSWAAVDTSLRVRADGSYAPVVSPADVVVSGGGAGPFVTYRSGGSTLTLAWPNPLPAPVVTGGTAAYADVLPGVDLRVTATATGFRHVLVVKTRTAAANPALASIRYQVGGDVVASPGPDGRVRFVDRSGATVAMTQFASMWDSSGASTQDGPGPTAVSAPVGVAMRTGNGLVLTPDAALLGGAGTVFPVFVDPQVGPTRTKWAWANNGNAGYDVNGQAWVGLNPPAFGGDGRLYRSFFDFPTAVGPLTYRRKHVLSATFSIKLDHSYSCDSTPVHLYRTSAITVGNGGRMSWGTRPLGAGAKWLASADGHANETGNCGGGVQDDLLMEFGGTGVMRDDVQAAASRNDATYTVGLCACNSSGQFESDQTRWKRFFVNGDTTMRVTYNTVPGTPINLSPHLGQVSCDGIVGTTTPTLQATYVDADGGSLTGTFQYKLADATTWTTVPGSAAPAGTPGHATVNLGTAAENKRYQFRVQTDDGPDTSAWSPACEFTVDTHAPSAPVVTVEASGPAPVYSACTGADITLCTANGGPGIAGAFRFSSPAGGEDVVKYLYGWQTPTIPAIPAAPGGPVGPIKLPPPRYGINTLAVSTVDGTGKKSPTTMYRFLVNGRPNRSGSGRWTASTGTT
jgi:hypothetical protein